MKPGHVELIAELLEVAVRQRRRTLATSQRLFRKTGGATDAMYAVQRNTTRLRVALEAREEFMNEQGMAINE